MTMKVLTALVIGYAVVGFISSIKWIFNEHKEIKKSKKKGVVKPIEENHRENEEF